jgi:hypothetical protein
MSSNPRKLVEPNPPLHSDKDGKRLRNQLGTICLYQSEKLIECNFRLKLSEVRTGLYNHMYCTNLGTLIIINFHISGLKL